MPIRRSYLQLSKRRAQIIQHILIRKMGKLLVEVSQPVNQDPEHLLHISAGMTANIAGILRPFTLHKREDLFTPAIEMRQGVLVPRINNPHIA